MNIIIYNIIRTARSNEDGIHALIIGTYTACPCYTSYITRHTSHNDVITGCRDNTIIYSNVHKSLFPIIIFWVVDGSIK